MPIDAPPKACRVPRHLCLLFVVEGIACVLSTMFSVITFSAITLPANAQQAIAANLATAATLDARFQQDVLPLLEDHCYDCHADGITRGGHDFGLLKTFDDVKPHLASVIALGKAARHHTMPPPDKAQPTQVERDLIDAWARDAIMHRAPDEPIDPGAVTLRRLNREMYANTIRDLLFIDQQVATQITNQLPSDDSGYGFDHIGDVLSVSPLLIQRYLTAAEDALGHAFLPPEALISTTKTYHGYLMQLEGPATRIINDRYAGLLSIATASTRFVAPVDATYELVITAHGTHSGSELPRADLLIDGTRVTGFDITSKDRALPDTHSHIVKLKAGEHILGIRFPNDHNDRTDPENHTDRNLIVHNLIVKGPIDIDESAIPRGQHLLFAGIPHPREKKISERNSAAQVIQRFTRRAFRRPVKLAETARYVRLYELARRDGERYESAVQMALSAALVSPEFLFMVERHPAPRNPDIIYTLNDHELATRLSYFLWSSMPDDELIRLAEAGTLSDPTTRQTQVRRMLADKKAQAFIANFTGQWLQLRNLEFAEPDTDRFGQFSESHRFAARREVELLFEDAVRNNRSIMDLIDSPQTFVNASLADFYGIDLPPNLLGQDAGQDASQGTKNTKKNSTQETFVRVQLPHDSPRGGVLTSAAVLTVTSHATRTSPVKRGLFMLENILGAAPPPPPPDVPQIDESKGASEATTLRERLEEHLVRPDCKGCHLLMDPIGYSLEHFDAIGQFRELDEGNAIDDTGELPDGTAFEGPEGLKKLVLDKQEWFAETLTEKLLVYALGRGLEPSDEAIKLQLTHALAQDNHRIGTLIEAIVDCDLFLKRRGHR